MSSKTDVSNVLFYSDESTPGQTVDVCIHVLPLANLGFAFGIFAQLLLDLHFSAVRAVIIGLISL